METMYKCTFKVFLLILFFSELCYGDHPCHKQKKKNGTVCVCNAQYCDTISTPKELPAGHFHLYTTSKTKPGFNHVTGQFKKPSHTPKGIRIEVNAKKTFQKVRGFGGAFTDSVGYNLKTLPKGAQDNLIRSYFSENGIEYTACRVVLGSCDFGLRDYTYAPHYDPLMKSFRLTKDDHIYKIHFIKEAMKVSPHKLSLLGSSWNAPNWMRNSNSTNVTYINENFWQSWGDYYTKTLEAFKKEGIDFWGLTTGNEPITLFMVGKYLKSMNAVIMFPEEQRDWIIHNLGPSLRKNGFKTKIYILDDMRYMAGWFMDVVMNDPKAKEYVAGVGLHWYSDILTPPDGMDKIVKKYHGQEIIYTESSFNDASKLNTTKINNGDFNIGQVANKPVLGSWERGAQYAVDIIQNLNHFVTTYIDWNLALDMKGGPNRIDFPCDAAVIVDKKHKVFYKQPMFYVLGHFSKFITPGSFIIETRKVGDEDASDVNEIIPPMPTPAPDLHLQFVASKHHSSSRISLILYNPKSEPVEVIVHDHKRGHAILHLDANSLNTLLYW